MSKLHRAKAAIASSQASRRLKRSSLLVSAAVAAIMLANPAHAQLASNALPTGGDVVAGSATIGTPTPSSMTINQNTDRAVINWNTFDIGSGASVTFVQPSTTSIAVNRVISGAAPSEIAGQLNANGRVAILNPNGVLFSGTANVNVGSLIASTGDIDQTAFMSGGNLDITGATGGEIVVNGNINITAGNLGLAAFVAPTVRNSGVITATAGRVQLGGGTAFTLDLAGDGLLSIGVPASSALVENNGQIFAEGGRIQMSAKSAGAAVDNLVNTGTLSVDSATIDNGTIVLEAVGGSANLRGTVAANDRASISQNILISSDQAVNISGNLSGASGTVNITAPHIYGAGKVSTATALKLNLSNNGTDTTGLGNYINDALGVIGTTGFGTTIRLGAGVYRSGVRIDASDVTIDGQGVAKIGWTSGIENAIDIWGDYVTIKNLEISGPATSGYTSYAWGSTVSRGIFVNRYADTVQLLNNNIHDIRTGIIVDGRNTNTYLLNNTIDNTKSAISIQYTDGSNVTMTGNHGSTYGNEWGINLHLNGILQADGVTILPSQGSLGASTPLAEQQRLLALRAANGGMEVQNQAYSASNRTAVYVSTTGSDSNQGSRLGTLASVQAGVNAVVTGGTVNVADGTYNLSNTLFIQKSLTLLGASEAGTIFDASGLGVYGMRVHADNVSVGNFTLLAPSASSSSTYGMKVEVGAGDANGNARIDNFAISNVSISGSRKTGLDLNSVIGATIDNVNVTGALAGNGISITDSADILVRNSTTSNNAWGGLALYLANRPTGSDQQLTGITIEGNNSFGEANGLYLQDSSTLHNAGALSIAGFDSIVRNGEYIFFRTGLGNATSYAAALGASASVEGWAGTGGDNSFTVIAGMSIGAAARDVRAGGSINVGAGTYAENVVINKAGVSLLGAGRDVTTINGISGVGALGTVTLAAGSSNTTLSGFTINGIENGNPGSETAAVYLQQTNTGSRITGNRIVAAGDLGLVSEWGYAITGLVVDGNIITGKTYVGAAPATGDQFTVPNVSRQLVALGGGGVGGGISFTNNVVNGDSGLNTGVTIDSAGSTITGNSFATTTGGFGAMLRVRGAGATLTGNAFDMAGVAYTANGLYISDAALGTASFADLLAANTLTGAGAWSDLSATGYHTFSRNIQAAVNEAAPGAIVTIRPGDYLEGVTGVGYYGDAGAQSFGLYLYKDNITLRGVDAAGNAITDADDVAAFITARYQAGFGAQHFISGNGITIEGLGFKPAAAGDNKTVEVIGNAFTLRNSVIDNSGNQTAANLYIDDFNDPARTRLESFTITGNKFLGGTYASAMVVVAAGAGRTTDASNRVFANNSLTSSLTGMRGFQIQGYMPNTPWQQLYAGAVTVTGNSFDVDIPVRTVGLLSSAFAWDDVFRNNGNSFLRGGVLAYEGSSTSARATITAGGDPDIRITSTIDASIARAQAGDTVRILDGTYVLGAQLKIDRGIALIGQSQAGTILDGRTVNNGGGLGTIGVYADNTSLANFTLLGSTLSGGNYGIKVQPNPVSYAPSQRISNVTISDVTVKGSRRAELDINGAVGVTITNFTADGQNTEGAGVQITDSANVTLNGVHTLNNNWGGVALYQTNRAGGYDGQTTNISIDAAQNNFEEFNGLFSQLESTTQGFGQLNLTGYGYALRNTDHRANGGQFTYFRTTLQDATTFGLSLGFGYSTSLENYTGTGFSNIFTVVPGLTISAAARDVRTGGTINVAAGTYGANASITTNGVSLIGAAGAKIDASTSGSNGITINADGVTVSGFEIFGPADQSYVTYVWPTITRGIVVANGADNVTVTGNTITGVRNGILIDGRNTGTSLTNNVIDNTKSAISVQYTDGSNLNIAGNSEGAFGNEWGIITYLNGIWNGTTITPSAGALGPNTPLSEQARLLALAAANGGMAVYNQGYSAANRTRAYVTTSGTAGAQGSQRTLLNLQGGLDAVVSGGTVYIGGGTYNENVTLDAPRVLNMTSPITVNSLSFGAGAAGTNIGTSITATGDMNIASGMVLTGDTTLLAGGALNLGSVLSPYNLTLTGNTVSLGQSVLNSLSVTGTSIVAAPVYTVGSQQYDGATTLNGTYYAGDWFTVSGQATLAGDTSIIMTEGDIGIASLTGAHAFSASAGTRDVSLGQATGLASIAISADEIVTAGASTSGAQSYTGATTLNGTYTAGGAFTVNGATTLAGVTQVDTSTGNANIALGAITGATDLTLRAGSGNVVIGLASGLANLSVYGTSITTVGATTSGAQLYSGSLISLGGNFAAGSSLTFGGATQLTADANVDGNGSDTGFNVDFGTIAGNGHNLVATAHGGQLRFGTVSNVGTLTGTGGMILSQGASTNGAQTYNGGGSFSGTYATNGGAFTLNGSATLVGTYSTGGGAFAINGTSMLGGAMTVTTAGGNASFGNFASFGFSSPLTVNAGTGNVVLGTATGISTFTATGATIATAGMTSTGAQTYTGATTLAGTYTAGGAFTVNGATTIGANTSVTAGGNAGFGTIGGTGTLAIDGGANAVTLGAVTGLASLSATGATIATSGASTSGAQSYTGATTLNGSYATNGGAFTVTGAATTVNAVSVATSGGNASLGTVGGAGGLSVNAGSGNVTLGAVSGIASLSATGANIATAGATTIGAQSYTGATTLAGSYATNGSSFAVNGASTLGGNTSIATSGGSATLGTVGATGTGNSLSVNTGIGSLTLGAVSGLGTLTASGGSITTAGAVTSGAQSYTGSTNLNGTYAAGGAFTVNGATTLGGNASVTAGGNAVFGTIGGARALALAATGSVTLGAVNGLTSLSVTGTGIATNGAVTSGAQSYTGATLLRGNYTTNGGTFTVTGTSTLALGATNVTTQGGNASFRAIVGPNSALNLNAGTGNVTLGAVNGITSLTVTGATITTAGASTVGGQTYFGETRFGGNYSASNFSVLGNAILTGSTVMNTNIDGSIAMGSVIGNGSTSFSANAGGDGTVLVRSVTGVTDLSLTGRVVNNYGAVTSGSQSYTGSVSLAGEHSAGGDFTVNGATDLAEDTSVTAGGNASFGGAITGAQALTVGAGGNVTLGAVSGLTALSATGSSIATAGASTSGAQSYTGDTVLNGSYDAASFSAGAATLAGATSVTTTGDAALGTIAGGGNALAVTGGSVSLGAASGLASLTATGTTIATSGVSSTGAQSYTGATSLNGAYNTGGGAFTVNGAAGTVNAVSVATAGGSASFGTVGGAGGLTVNAGTGSVTLGAVNGIASLAVTGANIATTGAATLGAQNYTGATSLNGVYASSGGFTVSGAVTLAGATTVTTQGGNAVLGATSGLNALVVNVGTGNVTLGAASGLASLSVTGGTIVTAGASTSGAQSYTGATVLGGAYAAGSFAVNGATSLAGATTVTTTGGNVSLGNVSGSANFGVNTGTGTVSVGAVTGLASLTLSGATIATNGVSTVGSQSYTGATSLNGAYTTAGGAFTVAGATNLAGNTSVTTVNGAITLGTVDAAVAGSQGLALNAGSGSVALGNSGATRRLGATTVNAGSTVLNGGTYAANSLAFTGGTGATVRLTQGSTTFNTTLPGGAGGAISIQPDLVGTVNAQQNVTFTAGNGLTANSGDVTIGNAGTDAIRLGTMSVTGHDFTGATVKLAGTFTSVLSGSQAFSANTLDTLGNVNARVAGNESGPIRAGGSVTINAGGTGSGSIIAGGPVDLDYGSSVSRAITAQSNVSVSSSGGSITGPVTATGAVELVTTTGAISGSVNAGGAVTASTTSGSITGPITAGGAVSLATASGAISSTVTSGGSASLTSQSGAVGATVTGTGGVSVATNGNLTGSYTSPGAITLTSLRPIDVTVNGAVVTVTAPSGTVTGVFSEIHTNNTGTLFVNDQPVIGTGTTDARQIIIDTFVIPAGGRVAANGEIQLPTGLALGLIAPAGDGRSNQRPPVVVNSVSRLGELLRVGYTAIIIQLDDSNLEVEEELAGQ
ncbi:filamentous hemagglutinin family protein [Sphingomonas kyeonggiensis]|uniref:Filamentous hemagglutinin family protein n=1 Tax=Sphingomonas kyeonggiensis TaxID=1268553 RepID=A0A7W7NQU5_9SPHN|nr:filamentous hemagglutinin N-terminal domain-containing protein [Sphingomonas kyeonggiensis]MBB4838580.1 filamentous hemagglutinin family protein [Sphingomonas kyeonggiensis]